MADDAGIGILRPQIFQQAVHRPLLGLCPRVSGYALGIDAAFVADADGTAVVVAGMGPSDILWQDRYDLAVHPDVVMVGGLSEAAFAC